jgi:hypothetical protein
MTAGRHREPGTGNLGDGFHPSSSHELAHALGWDFSMDDGSMTEECSTVLELRANIRDVQRSLDLENDMCALGHLVAHALVLSPDVAGAAGVRSPKATATPLWESVKIGMVKAVSASRPCIS